MKTLATAIILFSALPAQAQTVPEPGTVCADRVKMLAEITGSYGEAQRSIGLGKRGLMETFSNEATGSFTVTITDPSGNMCILAGGHNYDQVASVLPPVGKEGRKLR